MIYRLVLDDGTVTDKTLEMSDGWHSPLIDAQSGGKWLWDFPPDIDERIEELVLGRHHAEDRFIQYILRRKDHGKDV